MAAQEIKFGDAAIDKKEFYSSKHTLSLKDVQLDKIVTSNKWKINETTCKYYKDGLIRPLCVIMPQMNVYIKYFSDGGKNMSFISDDKEVYDKYGAIWSKIGKLLKLKFSVNAIRDDKYVCCKLKIFGGVVRSTFNDDAVPVEKQCYLCIVAIDIDSVLKVDKKVYLQAYLEQCKYKLKKRKPVDFIGIDIIDDSESDDKKLISIYYVFAC